MEFPFLKKHESTELDSKILHLPTPVLEVCSKATAATCVRGEQNTPPALCGTVSWQTANPELYHSD